MGVPSVFPWNIPDKISTRRIRVVSNPGAAGFEKILEWATGRPIGQTFNTYADFHGAWIGRPTRTSIAVALYVNGERIPAAVAAIGRELVNAWRQVVVEVLVSTCGSNGRSSAVFQLKGNVVVIRNAETPVVARARGQFFINQA